MTLWPMPRLTTIALCPCKYSPASYLGKKPCAGANTPPTNGMRNCPPWGVAGEAQVHPGRGVNIKQLRAVGKQNLVAVLVLQGMQVIFQLAFLYQKARVIQPNQLDPLPLPCSQ